MAQIAPLTVFDGAAVPVQHIFLAHSVAREGANKVVAKWRENLAGVPVYASPRIDMNMERLKTGVYRTEMRVVVPVMEAVLNQNATGYTAAPKVAYENTFITIGLFHERSDANGRRLVKMIAYNLLANNTGSTPPVAAGVADDLYSLLIAPT